MTGSINRLPVGLLDMLDMKSRGQTPRELANQVIGVLDMLPMYTIDREQAASAVVSGVAVTGYVTGVQVPADEIWLVKMHGVVGSAIGAGESCKLAPALFSVQRLGGNFFQGVVGESATGAAAGDLPSAYANRNYWAGPGDDLGGYVQSLVGTITVSTRVLYVPFSR